MKKFLPLALAACLGVTALYGTARAEGPVPDDPVPGPSVVLEQPEGTPAYARHDGTVASVDEGIIRLDVGEEQPETAFVSDDTVFLDASGSIMAFSEIWPGMKASVFVDGDAAVTLQYPPSYPAACIILGTDEGYAGADVDIYEASDSLGMYLNAAKTLAITAGDDAEIVPADGTRIRIDPSDLAGRRLAVFYETATMSLPPVANSYRIVVLGDAEALGEPPSEEPAYEMAVDPADVIPAVGGTKLLPVRKYAEGLGLEVAWDGALRQVTVGTEAMGAVFRIGENSYAKARMAPLELECAPVLIDSRTYVPVSFFEQVLDARVIIDDDGAYSRSPSMSYGAGDMD